MKAGFIMVAAALAMAPLVAGCGEKAALSADNATVRLPAVPGRPGAAYFTIHGGPEPLTLVRVSSPAAVRSEMHESRMVHGNNGAGVMQMAAIRDVAVPARAKLAFDRGGKHVMLYDIAPDIRPGATVPLKLDFAEGRSIEVQAKVLAAGQEGH